MDKVEEILALDDDYYQDSSTENYYEDELISNQTVVNDGGEDGIKLKIFGAVYKENNFSTTSTPNHHPPKFDDDSFWSFMIDSEWKLILWILLFVILILLLCYLSKCCYLIWDCCSDPFWGCCPRTDGCEAFCLMQKRHKYYYNHSSTYYDNNKRNSNLVKATKCQRNAKSFILEDEPDPESVNDKLKHLDESSAEALPQLYHGHYFNIFNLFGLGSSKKEYILTRSAYGSSGINDDSVITSSDIGGDEVSSIIIKSDHPSSRNGTYHLLPESELISVRVKKEEKSQKRLSRSMESFGRLNGNKRVMADASRSQYDVRNTHHHHHYPNGETESILDDESVKQMILFGKETIL